MSDNATPKAAPQPIMVRLNLTSDQWAELRARAARSQVPVAQFAAEILSGYLDQEAAA